MTKLKTKTVKNNNKLLKISTMKRINKATPSGNKKEIKRKKSDYAAMSVDDFFQKDFENEESSDEETVEKTLEQEDTDSEAENNEAASDNDESKSSDVEDEIENHKLSLQKLKDTDPDFYKFLQENDQNLLDFNLSEGEEDKDDSEEEIFHKPTDNLEVASDESDFEGDDDNKIERDERTVTLKMLKQWQSDIKVDKTNKTINILAEAFHAALLRVSSGDEEDHSEVSTYKIDGSSVFNSVIQLCVLEFGPAVRRFLNITGSKHQPHKCKKFVKIKRTLKRYFQDLLKLLNKVTSSNIQTVLLKHLHYMSSLLTSYTNTARLLTKRLISIWGSADEGVRVIAFFCILRITRNQQQALLDTVLKSMYITYVKNSKFVSVGTLPFINFMRRSLVEMYALDLNVSYQHVFLYIRQLAIHLRNAITLHKKDNIQSVYNWQYINSLKLWGSLLAVTYDKQPLQQLVYPLVQVALGTMKLVPAPQYYPLRFHVTETLIELSASTGVFIPILPFILEVLTTYDFNKKHQKVSMKPLRFTCILRCSKSQMLENGFKDTLIDTIYSQLLEYLSSKSHTLGFSDLSFICLMQIKQFLKKCKNASYNRKMKQICEKIDQNSQFINVERKQLTFNLTDFKQISGWETQIRNKGTPLTAYFESWNKLRSSKKRKEMTENDKIGDYHLPMLKKVQKKKVDDGDNDKQVELFPSDSEDEEKTGLEKQRRRGKRGGKNVNKKVVDQSGPVEDTGEADIVTDMDENDW